MSRCYCLLALSLFACKKSGAPEPMAEPMEVEGGVEGGVVGGVVGGSLEPIVSTSTPPAPAVELLSAGAEPRRLLQYKVPAGTADSMRMTMDMDMNMEMGGMSMMNMVIPTMIMDMQVNAPEVTPAGDMRVLSVLTSVQAMDRPDSMPGMADTMLASLSGMVGMTTDTWMTAGGVPTSVTITLPGGSPPEVQSQIDSMQQGANSASVPFPTQPVGVGAKWVVRTQTDASGMKVDQATTATLESMEGDEITLALEIVQTLADPNMVPPGMPPGAKVTITTFDSQGGGRSELRLDHLVPDLAESTMSMSMEFEVAAEGQVQPFSMDLEIAMEIGPVP